MAHRQLTKSPERRAAVRLRRLWQHQGKRGVARQLLAASDSWFTEGFDTTELQEAKVLLDEWSLSGVQSPCWRRASPPSCQR
jgi:predicted ATPase